MSTMSDATKLAARHVVENAVRPCKYESDYPIRDGGVCLVFSVPGSAKTTDLQARLAEAGFGAEIDCQHVPGSTSIPMSLTVSVWEQGRPRPVRRIPFGPLVFIWACWLWGVAQIYLSMNPYAFTGRYGLVAQWRDTLTPTGAR